MSVNPNFYILWASTSVRMSQNKCLENSDLKEEYCEVTKTPGFWEFTFANF